MRIPVLGVAAVFLLCATGCGADTPPPAITSDTATTTTPAPKPPLSMPEYQAVLTNAEQAVRQQLDRVMAATTLGEVDAARLDLATVLETKAVELEQVRPPAEVGSLHMDATLDLRAHFSLRRYDQASKAAEPNSC